MKQFKFKEFARLFQKLQKEYSVEEIMEMPVVISQGKIQVVTDEKELG